MQNAECKTSSGARAGDVPFAFCILNFEFRIQVSMKLTDVIRRPLITEKTTVLREDGRTLVFQVARDANKIDIKRAVEQLLGSKVADVRTSLAHGKMKRQGKYVGRRADWKKAYVTLREGEKLPDFLQGA
jgi:large subunit ribosomal protein L23